MTQESPTLGVDAVPANAVAGDGSDESDTPSEKTQLRLKGLKGKDNPRVPSAVTLIMPDKKGREQADAGKAVSSGKTLVVKRDEFRGFTESEAAWLMNHETFEFEKA